MSDVPLCLCHSCSVECHLPNCELLAYVKELERDKARLIAAIDRCYARLSAWGNRTGLDLGAMEAVEAAMQAMKEGK